jgi:uncharacterized BrkB/YihY/UPF0761 family membrane protein
MMALLLWTELSAIALLFGLACAAQLKGARPASWPGHRTIRKRAARTVRRRGERRACKP